MLPNACFSDKYKKYELVNWGTEFNWFVYVLIFKILMDCIAYALQNYMIMILFGRHFPNP